MLTFFLPVGNFRETSPGTPAAIPMRGLMLSQLPDLMPLIPGPTTYPPLGCLKPPRVLCGLWEVGAFVLLQFASHPQQGSLDSLCAQPRLQVEVMRGAGVTAPPGSGPPRLAAQPGRGELLTFLRVTWHRIRTLKNIN